MNSAEPSLDCRPAPPAGLSTSPEGLVDALAALSRVLVAITARALASIDVEISLSQHRTLVMLAARGPQRTVDLARGLGVHPSTVTRACDRLIRRGLVWREHRLTDRRVAWLALTEQGRDLLGLVMRFRNLEISRLVERTAISDGEAVGRALEALVCASGELSEAQWWRRWSGSVPAGNPPPGSGEHHGGPTLRCSDHALAGRDQPLPRLDKKIEAC